MQPRLLLDKQGVLEKSEDLPEIVLSWEFRIDFETAKAFRKSGGNYLRAKQWEDLTVEVRISWCEQEQNDLLIPKGMGRFLCVQ